MTSGNCVSVISPSCRWRLPRISLKYIKDYPYLEPEDIQQSLQYAAWLACDRIYQTIGA